MTLLAELLSSPPPRLRRLWLQRLGTAPRLQPLQLLLGRAQYQLTGGGRGSVLAGHVAILPSATLILGDTRYTAPVAQLASLAGQGNLPIQGQAGLNLEHLRLHNQWPERASGVVSVRGLGWTLGRETVLLGDYQATVEDTTAGLEAQIETLGGNLQVRGEARLGQDRSYELELQLKPGAEAPPLVNNLVRNLGKPDAQGWYRLRRQGSDTGHHQRGRTPHQNVFQFAHRFTQSTRL